MNGTVAIWLIFRVLRWIGWVGLLAYSVAFIFDRQAHFDHFGQLLHSTEAALFGFSLMAIFAGFFELMMRERAGLLDVALVVDRRVLHEHVGLEALLLHGLGVALYLGSLSWLVDGLSRAGLSLSAGRRSRARSSCASCASWAEEPPAAAAVRSSLR